VEAAAALPALLALIAAGLERYVAFAANS